MATSLSGEKLVENRFQNQTCVVTGAAQGLGYGIAERLVKEGAKTVALIDLNEELLSSAQSKLSQLGESSILKFAVDVTNFEKLQSTFSNIASDSGGIHVLIQAAGITGKTNVKTHDVEVIDFQKVMSVNLDALFFGCKSALPHMLSANYGRIVNIASIAGKEGNAGMLAYSTSKAAVIGMTKVMGKEYAETGITVNAIAPAVIRTAMVDALPDEQVKYMTDKIPMKRCGTVGEIAALATWIASSESSFTTGFTFDATGGRSVY